MPYRPNSTRNSALQALVDKLGYSRIARAIDPALTRQAVYEWPRIPERWLAVAVREFRKSKHALRPDLFYKNGRRREERLTDPVS
jgi:hypothetical protein